MQRERPLTHDERKASEAAFRGLPFDPSWSQSARVVYDGILEAMAKRGKWPLAPCLNEEETSDAAPTISRMETGPAGAAQESLSQPSAEEEAGRLQLRSRREAIEAGVLMDVTPVAESVGLNFAVGMTKTLWEFGIDLDPEFSEAEREARVRDVLMAVRLRLASLNDPVPFLEVPVMLAFPPEPIPQIFPIYALFHKDPVDADSLLLIHPGEVMFAKLSFSKN